MADFKLTRHAPERRRRGATTLYTGCTCCCCCCLHTLGAIVGATMAPNITVRRYEVDDDRDRGRLYGLPGASLFWRATVVLAVGGILILSGMRGIHPFLYLLMLTMAFPGVMVAGGVVAIFILLLGGRRDRFREMKQVGKAVAGAVVGAGAGLLVMAGIFGLFRGVR